MNNLVSTLRSVAVLLIQCRCCFCCILVIAVLCYRFSCDFQTHDNFFLVHQTHDNCDVMRLWIVIWYVLQIETMILHLFTVANLYIMIELLFFYYNYVAYNIHHSLNYMLLISQVLINTISLNKFQQFEDSSSRGTIFIS